MIADGIDATDEQRPDEGRADPDMGDPVAGHDRPQAPRIRMVRGTLEEDQAGTEQEGSMDGPRTHHPAQVGDPAEGVAGAEVEDVGQVVGRLDREAAVDVDRALRGARRSRRVDHHVRRLGIDGAGRTMARRDGSGLGSGGWTIPGGIPDRVAERGGRPGGRRCPEPVDDQDPPHRRRLGERRGGRGRQVDGSTSTGEAVGGDQVRRVEGPQTTGHGRRGVAAEDRGEDGLQPAQGEDRDDRLGQHREEDPDPGARADAMGGQVVGGRLDGRHQLGAGQPADGAVVAFPGHRLGLAGRPAPPLECGKGVIEAAADPPARPLRPVGEVQDPVPAPLPRQAERVDGGTPEPGRVHLGARLEDLEVLQAGGAEQAGRSALGEDLRVGSPRRLGIGSGEGRSARRVAWRLIRARLRGSGRRAGDLRHGWMMPPALADVTAVAGHRGGRRGRRRYLTMSSPTMFGWTVQMNVYVPAGRAGTS